ncbi:MAG: SH3 domain-containing protein [Anaerolineaceae bacterium]|nr:SH3 domain-containing protein [Anaerolineaceae bacterium]
MSLGRHPRYSSRRGGGGPPTLVIFLVGAALVFGLYYIWLGVQNFVRTGGMGVEEVTQQAQLLGTATAENRRPTVHATLRATLTPIPECQEFIVSVPNAIVREQPSLNAAIVTSLFENDQVCVIGRPSPESEWYLIDSNPGTRRLEIAYMHESVLRALNPTPTPTDTFTPLPTVTTAPTNTPPPATATPLPLPTQEETPPGLPTITPTPLPSVTPTPTQFVQSA